MACSRLLTRFAHSLLGITGLGQRLPRSVGIEFCEDTFACLIYGILCSRSRPCAGGMAIYFSGCQIDNKDLQIPDVTVVAAHTRIFAVNVHAAKNGEVDAELYTFFRQESQIRGRAGKEVSRVDTSYDLNSFLFIGGFCQGKSGRLTDSRRNSFSEYAGIRSSITRHFEWKYCYIIPSLRSIVRCCLVDLRRTGRLLLRCCGCWGRLWWCRGTERFRRGAGFLG